MTRRRILLALLAAAATIGLLAPPAFADATVVQPTQTFAGNTYSGWSIAWWRWAFSLSGSNNPIVDPSGASCGVNQRGAVWFLAGVGNAETSPVCTVPEDKAVLAPVINGECSTLEGTAESDLASCAQSQMDLVDLSTLTASVDGQPVDATQFRFHTNEYAITAVPNNPFGAQAGTGRSVADGFYLLLRPLSAGRHTVDVHGSVPAFKFSITTHYTLRVMN